MIKGRSLRSEQIVVQCFVCPDVLYKAGLLDGFDDVLFHISRKGGIKFEFKMPMIHIALLTNSSFIFPEFLKMKLF